MADELFGENHENPVFKEGHIRAAAFFGGPMAATYMIARNFSQWNDKKSARIAWILGVIGSVGYFAACLMVPDNMKYLTYAVSLIFFVIAAYAVQFTQRAQLELHIGSGGSTYSPWRAVGVVMVCLAIIVLVVLLAFIAMDAYTPRA